MAPQSGDKDQFYCTVYYVVLNYKCEAQRISKRKEKCVVRSQNYCMGD
jgi:hypothetical protein